MRIASAIVSWMAVVAPFVASCASPSAGEASAAALLHRGAFEHRLLISGELEAERAAGLSVPATNARDVQIRWIAREGTEVKAGEKVVELDPSELLSGLSERESEQLTTGDELHRLQAQAKSTLEADLLTAAEADAELAKATMAAAIPAELVSGRELADRELRLAKATAAVEKAKNALAAARAAATADVGVQQLAAEKVVRELAETRSNLELLTLRAPRDGVVVVGSHPWEGRKFQAGDSVWPGFPLATLPELDSLLLVAQLSDVDDGRLAIADAGRCVLDAFPESPVGCRVRSIAPMAQEVTRQSLRRTFRVIVALDQVDVARFRPGMSARAEIVVAAVPDALLVTRTALSMLPMLPPVAGRSGPGFAAQVNLASGESRAVTLGACNEIECVVLAGLNGDERLRLPERRGN
ncbi:MAG: efflux RND transporter periplasmic adaptor subunit [Thermoanaerobaculia bacterium]